jgi:signal peptidase II
MRLRLYATPVLAAAVAFFVDQATKQFARGWTPGTGPFPSVLTIVHHQNEGLVANLPVPLPVIVLITIAVLLLVFWMLWASVRRNHAVGAAALGVLIGGALGNFVDRLLFGYVFDWILLVGRSALNVADLCILLGALVYAGTATRLESSTAVPAD